MEKVNIFRKIDDYFICSACGFVIAPPHGKPFSNGDGKMRCVACAVEMFIRNPGAAVTFRDRNVMYFTPSS